MLDDIQGYHVKEDLSESNTEGKDNHLRLRVDVSHRGRFAVEALLLQVHNHPHELDLAFRTTLVSIGRDNLNFAGFN